ncbi:MAG: hypothetical protein KC468_25865, partial [Myxococcales bacterium]|nr:hypothetical protein [Myxococcales bacterium]
MAARPCQNSRPANPKYTGCTRIGTRSGLAPNTVTACSPSIPPRIRMPSLVYPPPGLTTRFLHTVGVGWLRDAWDSRGVHSPNDCAARMLRSAAWPPEITYKKLYLGNRIRALERGEGAHWWLRDERRQIVVALAEVLEWQVDVLRGAITGEQPLAGATPLVASGRTPLAGLGRIRPLHLDSEALPPGVPETVVHPARWRRHWWYSADHATLELAARWLSRRRRAHVVHASSLREAAPRVPARGRVFILLRTWKRGDDPRAYFTAPEFSELRVCVAAPFPHDAVEPVAVPGQMLEWRRDHPDEQSQAPVTTWESLGTHPFDAFGEVADWAADRLPQHRRGVIGRAREAVSASGLGAFITGPVDALEFIGLVHYLDGRHPLPRTIADWVRAFHEALHGSQEAGITVDVLRTAVGILEQRETTPLAFGLTEKEWSRGFADALEGRHATPSGGREFEQLAERGLLVERSRGRWVLGPAIFRRLLSADAFQGIFTDDEHQLGLLLSRPHIAARVVDRLIERYRVQLPPAIEGKREVHSQRLNDPIAMMGFEARLRAFGLAVLLRKDAPKDLVEHAVEAFHRLFLLPAATRLPYPLLGLESAT